MKLAVVFFHVGLILLVGYLLARRWGEIKSKLYWSAFACHLLAGICVGLVYLY
jgi:hypothetical protein